MKFLLHHIEQIIKEYPGNPPLAVYLKRYFKSYPRLGSRDRRALTEAVFIYYRCAGFAPGDMDTLEIIAQGLSLCQSDNRFLKEIFSKNGIAEKAGNKGNDLVFRKNFPGMSPGMHQKEWARSMFQQPDIFIRIRENKEQVFAVLNRSHIPFRVMDTHIPGDEDRRFYNEKGCCIALPPGIKLDTILPVSDYVVQDWSSQYSIAIAAQFWERCGQEGPASVWDVCAGAGGKSLFWKDKYPRHQILASDIRKSILNNLEMRFDQYALSGMKALVLDATNESEIREKTGDRKFDAVICDVPCSGSGTWSRTPEQLYFFRTENLDRFSRLQLPIALNAQSRLKAGGLLFYITCSVFADENGKIVEQLLKQSSLKLLHQQLINGIKEQADSMFIAVFQK